MACYPGRLSRSNRQIDRSFDGREYVEQFVWGGAYGSRRDLIIGQAARDLFAPTRIVRRNATQTSGWYGFTRDSMAVRCMSVHLVVTSVHY